MYSRAFLDTTPGLAFIGAALRLCRESLHLTERDLAIQIGASSLYIRRLESGELPEVSFHMLERISRFFGITVSEFMDLAESIQSGDKLILLQNCSDSSDD